MSEQDHKKGGGASSQSTNGSQPSEKEKSRAKILSQMSHNVEQIVDDFLPMLEKNIANTDSDGMRTAMLSELGLNPEPPAPKPSIRLRSRRKMKFIRGAFGL